MELKSNYNNYQARVHELKLYDIFETNQIGFEDHLYINHIILNQNRVCYGFNVNNFTLQDTGEFRLILIENGSAHFMYVGDTSNVEKENKFIKEYLSGCVLFEV